MTSICYSELLFLFEWNSLLKPGAAWRQTKLTKTMKMPSAVQILHNGCLGHTWSTSHRRFFCALIRKYMQMQFSFLIIKQLFRNSLSSNPYLENMFIIIINFVL